MAKATNRVWVEQDPLKLLKKRDIGVVCQYTRMTDIGRELNRIENFYQMLLRIYPAIKRRIRKRCYNFRKQVDRSLNMEIIMNDAQSENLSGDSLKIGDKVKVLSYWQIRSTLNDRGHFKGLSFQDPMEKFCNKTCEVLKIPQYVLDKGGRQINRCKDVVILRGLYCDGKGTLLTEGCDMCCLHYWKSDWLKKIV